MRLRITATIAATLLTVLGLSAAPALADGPVGPDPSSNFPLGILPDSCQTDPTGTECTDAAVSYLDQARASLGQPAYVLPADFDSLNPAQQVFILTNSDRILYGLPSIPGLTSGLNQDSGQGVLSDNDPAPSNSSWYSYTSNWAGGYENIVLAYEGWMYDDGPGSGNLDCTATDQSGCWGHRQDILWQFGPGGPLAMGAAAGTDSSGMASYAMLIEQGGPGWNPTYSYTWTQAVADGAGGGSAGTSSASSLGSSGSSTGSSSSASPPGTPSSGSAASASSGSNVGGPAGSTSNPVRSPAAHGARAKVRILRVRIRGHRLAVRITAPRPRLLRCSLRRWSRRHGWHTIRTRRCSRLVIFRHLRRGRYRLRVKSHWDRLVRRVVVR